MASFDVESLLTNIPLQETIDLCVDLFFKDKPLVEFALILKALFLYLINRI